MKPRLLRWIACPECRAALRLEVAREELRPVTRAHFGPEERDLPGVDPDAGVEREVLEGALHCAGCGAIYLVREGIPRLVARGTEPGPESAHRWTTFDAARPEWEESFLDYAHPLGPEDFLGRVVLDAGCGYGRHAFYAARYGADVVALDSSPDAVAACRVNTARSSRVHVVLGDLRRPPLRPGVFDIVYCFGVLHHLDDAEAVLDELGDLLATGGRLALWVYGPRQGLASAASDLLRGAAARMEPEALHRVAQGIAVALRVFSHAPYRLLGRVPLARDVVSHLPVHDHHRWPFDVVVAAVYDRLRIPVRRTFKGEELELMLTERGYADVRVTRRVRNNESFRAIGTRR